ncbi:hypothetical protein [Polaribacter aquimarinus]|uniref:Uncharacterized protein n=1 Tax=Polaribacter aquimarinus TaxID=2100726 RepID=A0A2U2JCX0_9FLAO|nr:hypothetical protein [Polaribacter aquimarinus]PWG06165.1 hypothetical protein DIS07_06975 [Polaribacter aquimarinus]
MKKILLTLLCVLAFTVTNSQSKKEIANVYIKRAQNVIEESIDYKEARVLFEKAMKYLDTVTDYRIAKLGTIIYFELSDFKEAKKYSKQYFLVVKNKKSEDYLNQLELAVTIDEEIELEEAEERRLEVERIKKEKELRRIDSLKTLWKNKSDDLSLKLDSIYDFNKNSLALFKNNGNFGIINDRGEIIVSAEEYKHAVSYDGYILLMNKSVEPTKIYSFNTNSQNGFLLPSPSDFNPLSTHYGEVMLPRGNGRLVTYPNNSHKPLVYDLNLKRIVNIANTENLLKSLKKTDRIDKYNKEGEVKINKVWYNFGGHLGGGVHPLYSIENYTLKVFLCSIDGSLLNTNSTYQYIGAFHNNKLQALKGNEITWINQNGTKTNAPKDESGKYSGLSKVVKIAPGVYHIMQNDFIVLGKEKLEKLADFLRSNSK